MPERGGKDEGEDSPKASGLVLVRSPLLTSHKWRELVSSGRMLCSLSLVFGLFVLFRFRLYAFFVEEAATLRSIVLQSAGAPIATHTCFFLFSFCLLGDIAFSELFLYHCRFLFVWRVRRMFFPSE